MMQGKISGRWLGLALLAIGPVLSQAQDAFVVAGTIDFYQDLSPGAPIGRTFSATVHYDQSATATGTFSSGLLHEVNFEGAVGNIELSIYDDQGLAIHHLVAEGFSPFTLSSSILARQGSGGEDELFYEASSSDGFLANLAILSFKDLDGQLLGDLSSVPAPPDPALVEQAQLLFQSFASATGDGNVTGVIQLRGRISLIDAGDSDPYQDCAEQARNHGQYVSCVAGVSKTLRELGEQTGRESGQQQKQAARSR